MVTELPLEAGMAKKKPVRPAKDEKVLEKIQDRASRGEYFPLEHAKQRLEQREVTDPEMRYILTTGYREPKKDEFKAEHQSWNYAIKGKTVDDRKLRVAGSFDRDDLLIITVIDLEN